MRVQSPSGLALVPCALSMVDLTGQLRCRITHTYLVQKFSFLFLAPYARTTRYEEAFFSLENQGKKARFARAPHYNPPKVSNRVIFARILRTSIFLLTAVILKGARCFEYAEAQGPGSRNELPPAADYVTCRLVHLRCFCHTSYK